MTTIRRLYFYLVTFVSIEVVTWGLVGLLRNIFGDVIRFGGEDLALAIALVLVGMPIFVVHWLWAQRSAANDEEEHGSLVRALFLYAILLFTLLPVVQNGLALINRSLLIVFDLNTTRALLGGDQRWSDNLIAIVANGVVAAYFWRVLQADWQKVVDTSELRNIRRLYRYIWTLYGLVLTILGAQNILSFLLSTDLPALGAFSRPIYINGLAFLLVGTPLWVYCWSLAQSALEEELEQGSTLRLAVLYALSIIGAIVALATGGNTLYHLLLAIFGVTAWNDLLPNVQGPLSLGVPLGIVWLYYSAWLRYDISGRGDAAQQSGLWRIYAYILAGIGLGVTIGGLIALINLLVDMLFFSGTNLWGDAFAMTIAGTLATLAVGLPLWLMHWMPLQTEAEAQDEMGGHARRSLMRKGFLYLAVFAGVIGGMVAAVRLAFALISAALGTQTPNLGAVSMQGLLVVGIFVSVLVYHALILRKEGFRVTQSLATLQEQFAVIVFEPGEGEFANKVLLAFAKHAANIPLTVHGVEEGIPDGGVEFRAAVLPVALALNPPEALRLWLKDFAGTKIIVSGEADGWVLTGAGEDEVHAAGQAALIARQLAEGQKIRVVQTSTNTIWAIVLAVLVGVPLFFIVVGLLASLIFD
jgi:hypothetical protein